MSNVDLRARLDQLRQSLRQTADLISKLAESHEFSEGASDIAADIQESLQQDEEELELVKEDLQDILSLPAQGSSWRAEKTYRRDGDSELQDACQQLTEELSSLRSRFRRAKLQSKKNEQAAVLTDQESYLAELRAAASTFDKSEATANSDRNLSHTELRASLFANRRTGHKSCTNTTKDDLLLTASSDLTASLRQTHELLASELSRSRFAHETLEASNAALKELNEKYGTLDDLLSQSRGLLGSLLRSQKSDTWYLETTLYILLGTIAWLLFRRLLYGPMWWFVYLPFKFAWSIVAFIVRSGTGRNSVKVISRDPLQEWSVGLDHRSTSEVRPIIQRSMQASVQAGAEGIRAEEMRESSSRSFPVSEMVVQNIGSSRIGASSVAFATTGPEIAHSENDGKNEGGNTSENGEEHNQQEQDSNQAENSQGEHQVRRGDGTILRERDEVKEPTNPKKRMYEERPAATSLRDEL